MKLALGLDVQTNAKGGKFMSIEDSHQGALVCKVDVEVLWEPVAPKEKMRWPQTQTTEVSSRAV